jgi:hypothetical protein
MVLSGSSTFIISTAGNPWSGVYIVQTKDSTSMIIQNITTIYGWSASSVGTHILRISNNDPGYSCPTDILRV